MDEVIKKIAALGIPGIILTVAIATSGFTAALAAIGPGGIILGIATLGVAGLLAHAFAEFGTEKVIIAVVKEQLKTKSRTQIIYEIEKYPITKGLKLKIIDKIKKVS